jgi:hypothetical protein
VRVASGLYLNALNQALAPNIGAFGSMDAYYPATNMWDRRGDIRARWASVSSLPPAFAGLEEGIMFDLNIVPGANCDALTYWTLVTGTSLTLNAATKLDGTNSIQLSHNANGAATGTPFKVRAGQSIALQGSAGIRCTVGGNGGAGKGATLCLRNMCTGNFWDANTQTWIPSSSVSYSAGYLLQSASDAWAQPSGNPPNNIIIIPAESFAACGNQDVVDCRLELHVWSSGGTTVTALFDALYISPGIDLCAIFGYNGTAENLPGWYTSADSSWGVAVKVADLAPPGQRVMWKLAASKQYTRFQALTIPLNSSVTEIEPMREIGELVLAQTTLLSSYPHYPVRFDPRVPAYRAESPTGQPFVSPLIGSAYPPDKLVLHWEVLSLAEALAVKDEIWTRTRGGTDPLVFLPLEVDPNVALYGYAAAEVTIQQIQLNNWAVDVEIKASPLF